MLSASAPGPGLLRIPGGGWCTQGRRGDLVSATTVSPWAEVAKVMLPATSAQVCAFTSSAWADSGSLRIWTDAPALAGAIIASSPTTASSVTRLGSGGRRRGFIGARSALHMPLRSHFILSDGSAGRGARRRVSRSAACSSRLRLGLQPGRSGSCSPLAAGDAVKGGSLGCGASFAALAPRGLASVALDGVAGPREVLARRDAQDPPLGRGHDRPAKALVCEHRGDLLGRHVRAKGLRAGLRDIPHRAV
jgi:hypothetical protein